MLGLQSSSIREGTPKCSSPKLALSLRRLLRIIALNTFPRLDYRTTNRTHVSTIPRPDYRTTNRTHVPHPCISDRIYPIVSLPESWLRLRLCVEMSIIFEPIVKVFKS